MKLWGGRERRSIEGFDLKFWINSFLSRNYDTYLLQFLPSFLSHFCLCWADCNISWECLLFLLSRQIFLLQFDFIPFFSAQYLLDSVHFVHNLFTKEFFLASFHNFFLEFFWKQILAWTTFTISLKIENRLSETALLLHPAFKIPIAPLKMCVNKKK